MPRSLFSVLKQNTHFFAWTVILGFALWGAGSIALQQQSHAGVAGYIFGQKILAQEFDRASRSVELLTPAGKDSAIPPQELQTRVWDHLILVHQAKKLGITVSDKEVTQEIKKLFGGDDFNTSQYEMWVKNVFRENARVFEEQMRNFLMLQKLLDGYRPKMEPAEEEVWNWYKGLFKDPAPETTPTEQDVKKEKPEDSEAQRKEDFEKNKEMWTKSYASSKENEALSKAIEDIKKQAGLKNLLPPPPAVDIPPSKEEIASPAITSQAASPEPNPGAPTTAPAIAVEK